MLDQKPTVGRIVHYVGHKDLDGKPLHYASIITNTPSLYPTDIGDIESIDLCVFSPFGMSWEFRVERGDSGVVPHTWHWPEREED